MRGIPTEPLCHCAAIIALVLDEIGAMYLAVAHTFACRRPIAARARRTLEQLGTKHAVFVFAGSAGARVLTAKVRLFALEALVVRISIHSGRSRVFRRQRLVQSFILPTLERKKPKKKKKKKKKKLDKIENQNPSYSLAMPFFRFVP